MNIFNKRQKEKEPLPTPKLAEEIEDEGIPSVNRNKKTSKLVTISGFAFIIFAGMGMVGYVAKSGNKDKKDIKQEAAKVENNKIVNTLPALDLKPDVPEELADSQSTPRPIAAINGAGQQSNNSAGQQGNGSATPIAAIYGGGQGAAANPQAALSWFDRKRLGGASSAVPNQSGNSRPAVSVSDINESDEDSSESPRPPLGAEGKDVKQATTGAKFTPTLIKMTSATLLPNRNFILTKGTSIDCVLEDAIDSTQPGPTSCHTTRNIYSDNGQVLIFEKGTQMYGEQQGDLKLGQARIRAIFMRAKTPNGVVIDMNSPGADALGRSGLEGFVDTKFSERFGAAIMISLIKDSTQAVLAQKQSGGSGGTFVYGNTTGTGEKMVEKSLDGSVNIPPTLTKNQGEKIQIRLVGDLDFSGVYGLKLRK